MLSLYKNIEVSGLLHRSSEEKVFSYKWQFVCLLIEIDGKRERAKERKRCLPVLDLNISKVTNSLNFMK